MLGKIIKGAVKEKLRSAKPQAIDARPKAAIIFGAGTYPGIGSAIASRVAREGMPVYVTGRTAEKIETTAKMIRDQGGDAYTQVVNASQQDQVIAAFEQMDKDGFAVGLVVHNVGTNRPAKFMDIDPEKFEKSWRADCLSGFFIGHEAIRRMLNNQQDAQGARGKIFFTGASASLRGKAGFANFAANKAGLRSLAQAMAREFGPKGIHVAHIIIDGMVNGARLQSVMSSMLEQKGENGTLSPDDIADTYWQVYKQHRSSWTHELDLRPFSENW